MRGFYFLLVCIIVLTGCGSGSDSGKIFVPESGHPKTWSSFISIGTENFHGTLITSVPAVHPIKKGSILFVLHCAVCHGIDGSGKIGPNNQGSTIAIITAALNSVPLMQGHLLTLNKNDIEDIADYTATLGEIMEPVKGVRNTDPCMQCHGENLKGGIARISCFACHNGPDGSIGHPDSIKWVFSKDDPVNYHGNYGSAFVDACRVCHGINLKGGIGPPCSACHDGSIAPIL